MYNIISRIRIDMDDDEAIQTVMENGEVSFMFESEIEWQAERYIVSVRVGGFTSIAEAKAFGNKPTELIRDTNRLVLLDEAGNILYEVFDTDISVSKLKDSSVGKLIVNDDDYQPVAISIADFGKYSDLRSFGSLAYGVNKVECRRFSTYEKYLEMISTLLHYEEVDITVSARKNIETARFNSRRKFN